MVVGRSKGRHVIPVDLLIPRRLLASCKKNIWFVGSHMLDGAKLNSMSFLLFSFTRRTSHGFSASPLLLGFSCHKAEGSEAVVVVVVWNCERESFDSLQRIPGFQTFYWTTTTTECVCSLLSIQQRHTRIPWQGCLKGVRDGKLWVYVYKYKYSMKRYTKQGLVERERLTFGRKFWEHPWEETRKRE